MSPYNLPVDLASDEAVPYLDDPRMTSYNIPVGAKSDAELKTLVQRLIAGGWFAKGYFYEVDEPITKAAFDALVAVSGRIKAIEPRSRMVTPFWGNPDFDKTLRSKDVMLGRVGHLVPPSSLHGKRTGLSPFSAGPQERRRLHLVVQLRRPGEVGRRAGSLQQLGHPAFGHELPGRSSGSSGASASRGCFIGTRPTGTRNTPPTPG